MNNKKIVSVLIVAIIVLTQFMCLNFGNNNVYAEDETITTKENVATKYFYNQLTKEQQKFYNAIEEMLNDPTTGKNHLATGTDSYDLVANNVVTQADLESFATGSQQIMDNFGAARDAFSQDHPEVFYVDYDYLSIRVTQVGDTYKATLGTGRSDSYLNKQFENEEQVKTAIAKVNTEVEKIVSEAENLEVGDGLSKEYQQIRYVHNEIIKSTIYKLETAYTNKDKSNPKNAYSIRTVYGVFGNREAVCEGFARSLKMVLDRLDIPCVLVRGVYMHNSHTPEEHMWNYVQLKVGNEFKWYAVDATFDNLDNIEEEKKGIVSTEYLIVGGDVMNENHVPTGIISDVNFEFSYPTLEGDSGKYNEVYNHNGLVIEMDPNSSDFTDGFRASMFKVSYNGMGIFEAKKAGYYVLAKYYYIWPESGKLDVNEYWAYEGLNMFKDNYKEPDGTYTLIPHSTCKYIQFAITTKAPTTDPIEPDPSITDPNDIVVVYDGDGSDILLETEMLFNPNNTDSYARPPHVASSNPNIAKSLLSKGGNTYKCSITYDEDMKETGEGVGIIMKKILPGSLEIIEPIPDTEAYDYKVENLKFDGKRTFTFDFTPSQLYGDDKIFYHIQFTGVEGVDSGAAPMDTSYGCMMYVNTCSIQAAARGYYYSYGRPSLLDDVTPEMLESAFGITSDDVDEELLELLTDRLALVATSTTPQDEKTMTELMQSEVGDTTILKQETYNITMTLCSKEATMVQGMKVKVCIGFPAGYGPNDVGVTFKAYHYKRDAEGNITGIEELDCEVTPLGLVFFVDSFSPFAIAVLDKVPEQKEEKTVIITASGVGGTVKGSDSIIKLTKENAQATIAVNANTGYKIETIAVGENTTGYLNARGQDSTTITLNYEDLAEGTTYVSATFATANVMSQDIADGATPVAQPAVPETTIKFKSNEYTINKNDSTITGVEVETTVKDIIDNIVTTSNDNEITFIKDGKTLNNSDKVGTGTKLIVTNSQNQTLVEYTFVVRGDITGDGRLTTSDYSIIKMYIMELTTLSGVNLKAADYNGSGEVTTTDYSQMKMAIMSQD